MDSFLTNRKHIEASYIVKKSQDKYLKAFSILSCTAIVGCKVSFNLECLVFICITISSGYCTLHPKI